MILTLTFASILCVDLLTDIPLIRQGKSPRHGWSALLRSFGLAAGLYVSYTDWWVRGVGFVLLTLLYWMVFDLLLNTAMGWPRFYSGTTSFLDRLVGRMSDEGEMILKLAALATAAFSFFFISNHRKHHGNRGSP